MLARSRELIRCRCATALGSSSHNSSGSGHQFIGSGIGGGLADAHSRISAHESTRAGTTRSSSTSITPRLSPSFPASSSAAAASGGLSVSASAADLAFVSSLAAHFQEQHEQQQRKLRQRAPIYQQLHQSHRRSPFAHVAKPRSVAPSASSSLHAELHFQPQPQQSSTPRLAHALQVRVKKSSSSSKKTLAQGRNASAVRAREEPTECKLPMDMECGCKTKRLKEQQEAEALAKAAAASVRVTSSVSNQQDDASIVSGVNIGAAVLSSSPVVVTNSSPVVVPHHEHQRSAISFESSFHRRHLPQDCIAFSSPEGRKLFTQAINSANNYMQIYFPLAEQFITQAEPAFCGLATLAMCLNALQIDPGRLWKGPWRWFSEELFDCCTSLSVAKEKGISLSEFICLARCNGVLTDDVRADSKLSLDDFRAIVKRSCATNNEIVVLNYSRKVLGQTGDGHFSPIGGYHEENDMVLLLDVARFKYPPHWVRLPLVFEAMQKIDESIGLPRGLVVLKESAHATGPTLVKQLVHSATPELPLKPAPKVCCDSAVSIESARHVIALSNQS